MNNRKAKQLRVLSYQFASEWLKKMVDEDEAAKINVASVKLFESTQDRYVRTADGERICSAYSSRSFYKKLKKAYKRGIRPEFMFMEKHFGTTT